MEDAGRTVVGQLWMAYAVGAPLGATALVVHGAWRACWWPCVVAIVITLPIVGVLVPIALFGLPYPLGWAVPLWFLGLPIAVLSCALLRLREVAVALAVTYGLSWMGAGLWLYSLARAASA